MVNWCDGTSISHILRKFQMERHFAKLLQISGTSALGIVNWLNICSLDLTLLEQIYVFLNTDKETGSLQRISLVLIYIRMTQKHGVTCFHPCSLVPIHSCLRGPDRQGWAETAAS
jgi:hypothetical protein